MWGTVPIHDDVDIITQHTILTHSHRIGCINVR